MDVIEKVKANNNDVGGRKFEMADMGYIVRGAGYITVGSVAEGRIEIKSGLMPGDVVVTTGAYLLNSEYIFKKGTNPMEGMKM